MEDTNKIVGIIEFQIIRLWVDNTDRIFLFWLSSLVTTGRRQNIFKSAYQTIQVLVANTHYLYCSLFFIYLSFFLLQMALNPITRRALALTLRQISLQQTAAASSVSKIGSREVVGFGFNGTPCYVDRVDFPMPGVRFKENTPDIQVRLPCDRDIDDFWHILLVFELWPFSYCKS